MNGGSDIQLPQSKETRKLIAHSCKSTLCNSNTASVWVCVCCGYLQILLSEAGSQVVGLVLVELTIYGFCNLNEISIN